MGLNVRDRILGAMFFWVIFGQFSNTCTKELHQNTYQKGMEEL